MKSMNYYTLLVFAPLLVVTGVAGFLLPETLMSGAPAYNIFHILFGAFGLILVYFKKDPPIRGFNISFGLIDLYQAAASFLHLYPENLFRWRTGDDVLHIVIGAALVLIGLTRRERAV
ncbi:MAG: hypothetical protein JSS81_19335 [Acidobacteria bacterium]|nr:hypothetical protein [Acidobacteriota bacterium]